ncbi:MAG: type 4 fimbrial biosis protein PilY1, partial [Pseudomonadota bacterium]
EAFTYTPTGGLAALRRFASGEFNSLYYTPSITYSAPVDASGVAYSTSFTQAYVNGFNTNSEKINLSTSYKLTYYAYPQNRYLADHVIINHPDLNNTNGVNAYYYLYKPTSTNCNPADTTNDNCYVKVSVTASSGGSPAINAEIGADERQNFANWFSFYRTRNLATVSSASLAFSRLPSNYRIAWQALTTCTSFGGTCNNWSSVSTDNRIKQFSTAHKTNFFTWLTKLPASGNTPLRSAMTRAGNYFTTSDINSPAASNPGVDGDLTAAACRQNFHIMMTDGMWNGDTISIGNTDSTATTLPDGTSYVSSSPYKDTNSNSLADVAFKYWATDLLPGVGNQIKKYMPALTGNTNSDYWNPRNDPATWQHMVNFTVGLGLSKTLTNPDWAGSTYAGDYPSIASGTKAWPATNTTAGPVYDLWHAAINSRGEFFGAENPRNLSDAFEKILNRISSGQGSGTGRKTSSGRIRGDTYSTEAGFDSENWDGRLAVYSVNQTTGNESLLWKKELSWMPDPLTRKVYTWDITSSTGGVNVYGTVPFKWTNLSTAAKTSIWDQYVSAGTGFNNLGLSATEASALGGVSLVDYIRGSQTYEIKNYSASNPNAKYRNRRTMMGDIIGSSPILLGDQNYGHFGLSDAEGGGLSYANFVETTKKTRGKTVAVGANDGMMHIFSVATGNELFAYVPGALHSRLWEHAYYNKGHSYFVDGKFESADVYIGGSWKNYLFGSLGLGGNTFFALDVTNPDTLGANTVKWEITDPDFGKVIGRPVIAKLKNTAYPSGKWVAIYGNGYESATNRSMLIVVDIETGKYVKLRTDPDCTVNCTNEVRNGLSQPLVIKNNTGINAVYA